MLYHGSNTFISGKIVPHKSFHYVPYVYATSDWRYALVRAGRFHINIPLVKEDYDGNGYTLVELSSGAIDRTFDTAGYIYTVANNLFIKPVNCIPNEFVSCEACHILTTQHIPNILTLLLHDPYYKIIRYGTAEEKEYWKTVRDGKDGYLLRRAERVAQMMKGSTTNLEKFRKM